MFRTMNGMGPRGPMHGHEGFRCEVGPGILFALPALMFGGWVILAVAGALIGAVIMIFGSVFGGLALLADSVFGGLSSAEGAAAGFVIGFVLYTLLRRRNARKAAAREEADEAYGASDTEYTPMNSLNNGNG